MVGPQNYGNLFARGQCHGFLSAEVKLAAVAKRPGISFLKWHWWASWEKRIHGRRLAQAKSSAKQRAKTQVQAEE